MRRLTQKCIVTDIVQMVCDICGEEYQEPSHLCAICTRGEICPRCMRRAKLSPFESACDICTACLPTVEACQQLIRARWPANTYDWYHDAQRT